MPRIFMSYRRADSISESGRMHDHLEREFGGRNVFKDVDDIQPGFDFRKVLDDEVAKCDVLLAIIGPNWATVQDEAGNLRLHNPDDFVRIEVESGLRRGEEVLVIPVLIKNAKMPLASQLPESLHDLTYRNAVIIRNDPDFNRDMGRLIEYIHRYTKTKKKESSTKLSSPVIFGGVVTIALVIAVLALISSNPPSAPGTDPTPSPISTVPSTGSSEFDELYQQALKASGDANYPQAVELFTQLIEADSDYAPAYLGRGLAYGSGFGNFEQAIPDLQQAVELDPSYGEAFRYLGRYQYFLEDMKDVEINLSRAIELNPTDHEARVWLAEYYINEGEYNAALEQYDALLEVKEKLDSDQLYDIWLGKAYVENTLGNDDEALISYQQAIEADPERAEAYSQIGNIYVYQEAYTQAVEALDTAIDKTTEDADNFYNRGLAHLELGDFEQAISDFDRALILSPSYAPAYAERGRSYTELEDYESAVADLSQAIQRDANFGDAYYWRGFAHYENTNYEVAITDFTQAIELSSSLGEAYAYRGLSHQQLGDDESAKADLETALEFGLQETLRYEVLTELGWMAMDADDEVLALETFTEAVALDPEQALAYEGQANVFIVQAESTDEDADAENEWLAAIDTLTRGLENVGDDASLYFNRGIAHHRLGLLTDDFDRLDLAIADFQKATELDETLAFAYVYLAELAIFLDGYSDDDALKYAQTAFEYNDTDAYVTGTLAYVHDVMGNADEAIRFYELAVDNSDNDIDRNFFQGELDNLRNGASDGFNNPSNDDDDDDIGDDD